MAKLRAGRESKWKRRNVRAHKSVVQRLRGLQGRVAKITRICASICISIFLWKRCRTTASGARFPLISSNGVVGEDTTTLASWLRLSTLVSHGCNLPKFLPLSLSFSLFLRIIRFSVDIRCSRKQINCIEYESTRIGVD